MCNRCHTTIIKQTCCDCQPCNLLNTLFNNGFQYVCRDACGNIRVNNGCRNTGCGYGCGYGNTTQANTGCGCGFGNTTQTNTNGAYPTGFGCCRRGYGTTDAVETTTDGETYYARQYGCGRNSRTTCGCGW